MIRTFASLEQRSSKRSKKKDASSSSENEPSSEDTSGSSSEDPKSSDESSNLPAKRSILKKSEEVKRRIPKCQLCKNHVKDVPLRGHKRKCPFKDCECNRCKLVKTKRLIVKKQVELYRYGICK